jgi:hypothetical protein
MARWLCAPGLAASFETGRTSRRNGWGGGSVQARHVHRARPVASFIELQYDRSTPSPYVQNPDPATSPGQSLSLSQTDFEAEKIQKRNPLHRTHNPTKTTILLGLSPITSLWVVSGWIPPAAARQTTPRRSPSGLPSYFLRAFIQKTSPLLPGIHSRSPTDRPPAVVWTTKSLCAWPGSVGRQLGARSISVCRAVLRLTADLLGHHSARLQKPSCFLRDKSANHRKWTNESTARLRPVARVRVL